MQLLSLAQDQIKLCLAARISRKRNLEEQDSNMEILLKNGHVVDGSGEVVPYRPWFRADIGIENGRIIKIGNISDVQADRVIDITGLVVAPGFIDIHSHSDYTRAGKLNNCFSAVDALLVTRSSGSREP